MMQIEITPIQPFDFKYILQYWLRSEEEILHARHGDELRRVLFDSAGQAVLIGLQASQNGGVKLTLYGNTSAPESIISQAERIVAAGQNLEPFYDASRRDAVIFELTQTYCGMKIPQTPTHFEALVWAIIGQQINLSFAYRLKRRLVENFGFPLSHEGHSYYGFPPPAQLANLTPEDLRPYQFSRSKASYVIGLAQAVENGLNLEALSTLSDAEIVTKLTKVKGIGRWTAEYALMRAYNRLDSLPAADIGLRNAVSRFYQLDHQATESEVRALGETWLGWRGLATFYLWHGLSET